VRSFEASLFGGNVHGTYELRHLGGDSSSRLDATIREVSLNALSGAAAPASYKSMRLSGRADGTLSGSWGSTIQNLAARAHFDIRSDKQAASEMSSAIPLTGLIDLTYDRKRNVASFNHSYLQTRNTKISVTGAVSDRSQLDTQLETSDLREIAELVSMFRNGDSTSTDGRSSFPADLRGSARFEGEVLGSIKAPRIKGTLSANNLEVDKSHWRSLQVGVDASPSSVALQNGALIAAQKDRVNFSGRADLNQWSFTDSSPLSLEVDARQMSIGDLQELTRFRYPVAGVLNANISVHGSQQNPQGRGRIQISEASAWNERIDKLSVDFQGDGTSIHTETKLQSAAGDLAADLSYMPRTQEYEARVEASAIKLDQIQAVRDRKMGISGELKLSATGRGTVSNPQLAADIQIPRLQIRDQIISDVQTKLDIANRRAGFTLVSKTDQGSIQAKGDVGLEGEYPATASVDIRAIPVGVVLASYLPRDQKIQGTAELHADLTGPLKDPAAIVAHLEIPTLSVAYQSVQLALSRPLRVDYLNGLATIDQTEFKGTGTNLTLKGVIPVKSSSPLNISANGSIDLALLQGFATGVRSSGRIELKVDARGDLSQPAMEGEVRLVDATISAETVPVSLEGVNGRFQISGDRIEIAQFAGAAGGGTVSARGAITYGKQANFNVGVDMKSVRVRYPAGIRSILTGNLALNGTPEASSLTGRVLIDRLSFTQQFDLANFMGQFSDESPASAPSHLEQNMRLNVSVATADNLNLASSKVSIGGAANLSLGGTLADPVVLGRMNLNSGEIFFMGKRYDIQSGTIEFANPVRTTPVLNLYAKTTVQQYDITLNFVGPVDRLRTNFTSDPPLPPADIINLIGFGQTAEQAATSPSTPATLGAESVLAQGAASQVAGKIENLTGISQLTIDPLAGNSQANPGAQVAIQQRVTGNILLTFSTDVTSTENQAIQVQYQIKKNLSVSILRDEYGGYAADVRIHKTF
jgi:translocation and assembly module TamB